MKLISRTTGLHGVFKYRFRLKRMVQAFAGGKSNIILNQIITG